MLNRNKAIILLFILVGVSIIFFVIKEYSGNFSKTDDQKSYQNGKTDDPLSEWVLDRELKTMLGKMEKVEAVRYDVNVNDKRRGDSVVSFWEKGEKIRTEERDGGRTTAHFINMENGEHYFYFLGDVTATILSENEIKNVLERSIFYKMKSVFDNDHPVLIDKEEINDKECLVVSYGELGESKMWIWEEHGLPLKIEEELITLEVVSIDFTEIDDSYLEVPLGVEKVDYFYY